MAAEEAELLQLQLPSTAVEVDGLETGTNLLLAPEIMSQRMAHFSEDVFDLSPESHLVRFVKVLLGDAGAGQLRKQYLMSRLQQTLHGSHFYDIDRFYGALFGVRRRSGEVLGLDPYSETADSEQWADEHAKDNSYRSRVMQFARAIGHGATPTGMELVAEAILNVDCDVYETWVSSDAVYRTYAELEAAYPTYATMEGVSYGTLEGFGLARIAGNERREFVVRPKRRITLEESYDLIRVLNRLKPADARVIVDYLGVQIHKPADIRGVYADSEYWEVVPHVVPAPRIETIYQIAIGQPTQQPRPPFSGYQGEAWSYCGDVVGVVAYFDRHGNKGYLNVLRWFASDGRYVDYEPDLAIMLLTNIHAGRAVSDAILVSHPYVGAREIPALAKMRIDSNGQVYNLVEEATKLPQLYADRIPLDRLTDKLERTNDIATPQADSYQRYWATVPRFREDDIQETLEVRLKDAKRINNISFEVSRYPHTVVAELYDEEGGDWVEVFRREVLDSYPTHPESVPTTQTTDDGPSHPHHRGGANHWVTCARKLDEPIRARRFRITLQRKAEGGIYPLRTGAVYLRSYLISFAHRTDIAYSLAVRNIDLGYRVKHKNDIKHWKFENKTIIETSVDIAGSLVEYTLHTQPAAGIIQAAPQVWRSEPQPVGYAVVNLYADTRTVAGEPQVIDRFYIDPVHSGVSMSIYYNDEEGLELESDDPVDDFEQMVWSPIARDYTLQKGYVEIPPTRARFFKFEFTNLVAEPYETLVPVTRRIKVFSKIVIKKSMPKRKGRGEKHLSTGIKIIVSGVFDGTQRFKDRFEFVFRPTRNDRRRRLSLNISVTAARFTYDLAAKIKLRGKSWTFGFHKHHLGHHAPKFIEKIQHTYDTIEIEHTSKVAYFVGIKELRAYRVDYQADDNTEMYVDLFQDFENIAEGFTWQFDPDTKLTTQSNITAEAHSKVMASRSPIAGVQFATQQSDAVQIAPDDDFRDAAKANPQTAAPRNRVRVHATAAAPPARAPARVLLPRHHLLRRHRRVNDRRRHRVGTADPCRGSPHLRRSPSHGRNRPRQPALHPDHLQRRRAAGREASNVPSRADERMVGAVRHQQLHLAASSADELRPGQQHPRSHRPADGDWGSTRHAPRTSRHGAGRLDGPHPSDPEGQGRQLVAARHALSVR